MFLQYLLSSLFILIFAESDYIKPRFFEFTRDGAYCWFQDPRAVYIEGKYARTYAGWITSTGSLKVGWFDHNDKTTREYTIKDFWDIDDHNVPSFLVLPDKRIMIFYSKHNKDNLYSRCSQYPEDIEHWGDEIIVAQMPRVTYSHPVYLSTENRYYVFWRGNTWKPTYATSEDTHHWSKPQVLFQDPNRESHDIRPYLKVTSDSQTTIHFLVTDGHPRNEPYNSVYYAKYEKGTLYKANGSVIGTLADLPIPLQSCDKVYDAKQTGVRAWIWDIALNKKGHPVIVYTRLPDENSHFYHYAYWDGTQWKDYEITFAGPAFPETPPGKKEPEPHYSGGIVLNPEDPNEVYLSRKVGNTFELERWKTEDGGITWNTTPITANSTMLNVRPIFPRGYNKRRSHLLWMRGHYTHFTQFKTQIYLWVED